MADVYLTDPAVTESSLASRTIPFDAVVTPEDPDTGWVIGIHFDHNNNVDTTDWLNRNHVTLIDSDVETSFTIDTDEQRRYYRFGGITNEQIDSVRAYLNSLNN